MGADRLAFHGNLWCLSVLCLLREGPLHPYEMRRLIRQRHKDAFLDLKQGSLYHAVARLLRAELIEAVATSRQGRRPERTVYRLTEAGKRAVLAWLRELLRDPTSDQQSFFAALSFLAHLPPEDVQQQLAERRERLETLVAELTSGVAALAPQIGRVLLLESEFACAVRRAELAWVRKLVRELGAGQIAWNVPAAKWKTPGRSQTRRPRAKTGRGLVRPNSRPAKR